MHNVKTAYYSIGEAFMLWSPSSKIIEETRLRFFEKLQLSPIITLIKLLNSTFSK